MNHLEFWLPLGGIALLLGFLVLLLPLLLLLAGKLTPLFADAAPDSDGTPLESRNAPLARRHAAAGSTGAKVAIAPGSRGDRQSKPAKAKKKAAAKTKSSPRKKVAAKKKAAAKKVAKAAVPSGGEAAKKVAAKKTAKKKTVKRKAAKKVPAGAKLDPQLGLVYTKAPSQPDDLKKITGVAKVLEGKLHAAGVYTYRQIAEWTPEQMAAFGEKLSFKNRIERDDWKSQAAALHKEDHGARG